MEELSDEFYQRAVQLRLLAQLRDLQDTVANEQKKMLNFDIKKDPLYQEGRQAERIQTVLKLHHLYQWPVKQIADLENLPPEEVENILKNNPFQA